MSFGMASLTYIAVDPEMVPVGLTRVWSFETDVLTVELQVSSRNTVPGSDIIDPYRGRWSCRETRC